MEGPLDTGADVDLLVVRDPRESVRKCSLTPLRGLAGVRFVAYAPGRRIAAGRRILLHVDGPRLDPGDLERGPDGLLLIDCAWRRVERVLASVEGELVPRSLPPLATAYPRRSQTFADPDGGLASVEALFAATVVLGRARPELLADYRWREAFLAANPMLRSGG